MRYNKISFDLPTTEVQRFCQFVCLRFQKNDFLTKEEDQVSEMLVDVLFQLTDPTY
jgi:hypothetical protein